MTEHTPTAMTEHTAAPASANPASGYTGWAIVELMGHRRRAGFVREAEMFGTKLLRLDIPLVPPKPEVPRLDWYATETGYCALWDGHRFVAGKRGDGFVAEHEEVAKVVWTETHSTMWRARDACEQRFATIVPPPEIPPDVPLADLPVTTQFFGGSAIYALTPCTEAVARAALERLGDPRPAAPLDYRPAEAGEGRKALAHSSYDDEFESH